jgi:Fe-S cluster assembly protein SufB
MNKDNQILEEFTSSEYKYGFETLIENDSAPKGINEDIVRFISAKKNEPEWLLEWRLKAYRHWLTLENRSGPMFDTPRLIFRTSFITQLLNQKRTCKS